MSKFVVLAVPILLLSEVATGTQMWKTILYITLKYSSDLNTYEGWNFNSGNYLFTTDTK